MRFTFQVEVEVEREEGKFATRDELGDQLREAIEGADPGTVDGDNGGTYNVIQFDVEELEQPKPQRRRKSKPEPAAPHPDEAVDVKTLL